MRKEKTRKYGARAWGFMLGKVLGQSHFARAVAVLELANKGRLLTTSPPSPRPPEEKNLPQGTRHFSYGPEAPKRVPEE
jgi:hypothetical protein